MELGSEKKSVGARGSKGGNSVVRVTVRGELEGVIEVPPSKSYTHRAVLMAALASSGESLVANPLLSRDTIATIDACNAMGASVVVVENPATADAQPRQAGEGQRLRIIGTSPRLPDDVVNVENSGTTLRFMTSTLALAEPSGLAVLTGDSSIRRRPMQPLLDTLGTLGVQAWSSRGNGCAPVVLKTGGMRGGAAAIRGDVSSQFISSLLISSPMARQDTTISVSEAVSRPYIEATLVLAKEFGVEIGRDGYTTFKVGAGQRYVPKKDFIIPADFSSASFPMAAVALVGGRLKIRNLDPRLPQGDSCIAQILREMGVDVSSDERSLTVRSDGGTLRGGRFDLGDTPDLLPVVSVLALKCESPVEIVGTAHARFKETDRIAILAAELSKLGVPIKERDDGLLIAPPKALNATPLDSHDDHRMFMAFSLASMLVPGGVPIVGAESLDVSYPTFLQDMERLGAVVTTQR